MGRLEGKAAFVTGAAGGLGRSYVQRMAEEGADLVIVDICRPVDTVPYRLSSPEELSEAVEEVEALGRRVVARQADVRDRDALQEAYDAGLAAFGQIDVVVANAGIAPLLVDDRVQAWHDAIDINLTGTFHTIEVAVPSMIDADRGGSIVIVSSTAGLVGIGGASNGGLGYAASKHGVVGLMRTYANNLAPHSIRVNSVHPTGVATRMVADPVMAEFVAQDPILSEGSPNALPVDTVEPDDVANAVLWLASDEARYVTGVTLPVDAGFINRR
ncbi:mycofactocin-coupled SDR family oxidoreductase [Streptomyces sp. SID335]|uniref:SDR family mycofactocin-dependent oxidoreductase n=3 Tax=Streptomyces TaxID=1883 RepID=A0A5P2BKS5_STRVZ|nr:mycofactocin-coupled SDR family oxidoreductase [Streptomyces sp. SID335]NDZ87472.1 mycofactocin-coupled SDR family oxidoreductase [Streptomyces sp. SID10115]NEA00109.1 mycofactocin-coupled SDR family oxidoreductase [Streptomyces sp. SID10116]NEB43361.1 mycofactocin-coupled SDR family oxidoreductase [Streptomyces sp. SID339]QES31002.1 SDR family mycofactocin-dependent oxidoreductase [Streptomyces venezuelae]